MAAQEKTVPGLPVANSVAAADSIVCVANGATSLIPVGQFLAVNTSIGTPANSSAQVVTKGVMWTDGTYLYVATANNTCKRVSLTAF